MSKALVWLGVILVVVFGGRALVSYMSRSANENTATSRVAAFLRGMTPGGDFQEGFNMWETGDSGAIRNMTQDEYNGEVVRLGAWLAERGLGPRVGSHEIRGATFVKDVSGAAVKISCVVDGKSVTILAIKDRQLEWTD